MPAIKLCYSKLDFESRLAKNHTTTIALKGKKEFAALTSVKMQDICAVLWGFCEWEHVDTAWLHFPYMMVLVNLPERVLWVRLGNLPVTVASFLFSKVIKTIPALLTEGGLGVLMRITPLGEPPSSVAKQVILTHSKARLYSYHNLFWPLLYQGPMHELVPCHRLGSHLQLSINFEKQEHVSWGKIRSL